MAKAGHWRDPGRQGVPREQSPTGMSQKTYGNRSCCPARITGISICNVRNAAAAFHDDAAAIFYLISQEGFH